MVINFFSVCNFVDIRFHTECKRFRNLSNSKLSKIPNNKAEDNQNILQSLEKMCQLIDDWLVPFLSLGNLKVANNVALNVTAEEEIV